MTDETRARELLRLAAQTVEVRPAGPVDTARPAPRRWSPVALAVVAVVVVAALGVLATVVATGPSKPPPSTAPVPAVAAPAPPVLGEHRVPSVLGLSRAQALDLLGQQGAGVRVRRVGGYCADQGWALGTRPRLGAPLADGDLVVLEVSRARRACGLPAGADAIARRLVAFARGLGPAPAFAPEVTLLAGAATATLSADEAGDLARWSVCSARGCAFPLDDLARKTTLPRSGSPSFLAVGTGRPSFPCLHPPLGFDKRDALHLSAVYPVDGDFPCLFNVSDVYLDEEGRIAVVVGFPPPRPDPSEPTPQDRALGAAFVDWSRGAGPAPAFADEVTLLRDDEVVDVLPASEAADPRAWTDGARDALRTYEGQVAVSATPLTACGRDTSDLPEALRQRLDDVVRLDPPEVRSCAEEFAVELWTQDGRIDAVNLVPRGPG